MKKITLIVLVILGINYTNAQTQVRDSLKQLLKNGKEDTSRVLHLANLSFEYIESYPDTMMLLALEALALADKLDYENGRAFSFVRIGNAHSVIGNSPKALEMFLTALKIYEKRNDREGIQRCLGNIGVIYDGQEDYRQALAYQFKARLLAEQLSNKRSLSINNVNIAYNYLKLKIFDSAKLYAQQAYDLASSIHYPRMIGSALETLGEIHFDMGQYLSAMEHFRMGIPFSEQAQNYKSLGAIYLNMAKVFDKTNMPDSALFYARQSVQLTGERGFVFHVRDAARFLALTYRKYNADSSYFYQDMARAANDSIFSQQKQHQLQSLVFDEKLRQQEIEAAASRAKKERKLDLQYAIIFVGLICFILLFFILSRTVIVNERFISFFGILGLLAVFEFINLYIHPYLDKATNHSPFIMLGILMCIGALLVPLHHRMEKWITKIMVEKNKRIRLVAARKTIEKLEGQSEVNALQ